MINSDGTKKLYEKYECSSDNLVFYENQKSYEIPGYHGARASKRMPVGKLLRSQYEDVKTLVDLVERGCRVSENGPFLGKRSSESEYTWINYKEFINRAKNFGSGLQGLGLKLGQSCRICIYAKNSPEWLVTQYGSFYYSSVIVPLYDTIGPEAQVFMINHVESEVVICDEEKKVKSLLDQTEKFPLLKHIICIKDISLEMKELANIKGIRLYLFTDIEDMGKALPHPVNLPSPDDSAIICYTSGTTGNPKGAVLTHKSIVAGFSSILEIMDFRIPNKNDVYISYLPLAHIYEQTMQGMTIVNGGSIGFYRGDTVLLTDDMRILKPTIFAAVPRVLNKLYDAVESQKKILRSTLKENSYDGKNSSNDTKNFLNLYESDCDGEIYEAFSESLGGRIRTIISAAAPISDKVLMFCQRVFNCEIVEIYGQTECCGPCCINIVKPESAGCVGEPVLSCIVKLKDEPELGYFSKNNVGEVCIKGANVIDCYYKDPVKTSETIDENGWLITGDIGMWLPNGTLKLIDRKKHIFKLSQGEYIIPEQIERVYLDSIYISQILVHGESLQSFLVAIIVPDQESIMSWCKENSIYGSLNDICHHSKVKELVLEDMKRLAKSAGLLSLLQVKDIYLHPEALTVEKDQLTPTQKVKRYNVQKYFSKEIQTMYRKK